MKSFALIGAAGYVAPRHMRAIKETGGNLVAAFDPADSVGILDSYFPEARFFSEFERFDRQVDKLRRSPDPIAFVSICSPNYLHDAHVRFGLRSDAGVICEKPLVLNPWNLDGLAEIEQRTNRKINTILQLRLHPAIETLRKQIQAGGDWVHDVELSYVTPRGRWYDVSWKGDEAKAGGVATNIGIHFFDMLVHVFGQIERSTLHLRTAHRAAGYLELKRARVKWFLSIAREDLPSPTAEPKSWRSMKVDGNEVEFSDGFTGLHTESYREILSNRGFGIADVRPSIEIASALRTAPIEWEKGERHSFARAGQT